MSLWCYFADKPGVNMGLVIGIAMCVVFLLILVIVLVLKILKEQVSRNCCLLSSQSSFREKAIVVVCPFPFHMLLVHAPSRIVSHSKENKLP